MGQSYDEIINLIDGHLKKSGRSYYSEFYIGISDNARDRLFKQHHVDIDHQWWIYVTADNSEIARDVEKHYLDLGMRGGTGGGSEDSNMVYCYVVTPITTE